MSLTDASGRFTGSVVCIGLSCPEPAQGPEWYPNQDQMARLLKLAWGRTGASSESHAVGRSDRVVSVGGLVALLVRL